MNRDLGSLEHDVDASRARFDRSLSELGRRLAPTGLADEALGLIGVERSHSLRESVRNLVRLHPIPLLLLGSGIGLLLWEMRRRANGGEIDWYSVAGLESGIEEDEVESIVAVDVIEEFR
jgi:hypothetical protein